MPTPINTPDTEIGPPTRPEVQASRERRPGFLRRAAAAGLNRLANIISPRRNQAAGA
jgi:hypothetical protein